MYVYVGKGKLMHLVVENGWLCEVCVGLCGGGFAVCLYSILFDFVHHYPPCSYALFSLLSSMHCNLLTSAHLLPRGAKTTPQFLTTLSASFLLLFTNVEFNISSPLPRQSSVNYFFYS